MDRMRGHVATRWARRPLLAALLLTGCPSAPSPSTHPSASLRAVAAATGPRAAPPRIDLDRMLIDVAFLSNDAMAGRDSRDAEVIEAAARYIAQSHRDAAVAPAADDYRIAFSMAVGTKMGTDVHLWLEIDGASKALTEGYAVVPTGWDGTVVLGPAVEAPGVGPSPSGVDGTIAVVRLAAFDPVALRERASALLDAGALGIVATVPVGSPRPSEGLDEAGRGLTAPLVVVSESEAGQILPISDRPRRGRSARPLPGVRISIAPTQDTIEAPRSNVVSFIEGSDLASEVVIVGAHYDHIGRRDEGVFCTEPTGTRDPKDQVCNGADDNASGTAMVMELARAIGESGQQPRRTLVFAHFAGEELGLLGSRALAEALDRTPPFEGREVVAMLNLDMVGRYREDVGLSIGALSSSDDWGPLLDTIDDRDLHVVREAEVNARSDHASFHAKGVPVLFFFTGLHRDYHRTTDELALINPDGMHRIAQMVLDVTVALAEGHPIRPASAPVSGPASGPASPKLDGAAHHG